MVVRLIESPWCRRATAAPRRCGERAGQWAWENTNLQPRINRLALQRQHTKHSFMHAAQRFFPNEPFEIFCRCVFRAVDDAEIFTTATLNGRLHEAAPAFGDELQRLHDHAFAAASGQFLPPTDARSE